jgi:hypothetical protein
MGGTGLEPVTRRQQIASFGCSEAEEASIARVGMDGWPSGAVFPKPRLETGQETRDLLAPDFGLRVLRVAAPERDATLAFARFQAAIGLETAAQATGSAGLGPAGIRAPRDHSGLLLTLEQRRKPEPEPPRHRLFGLL